MILELNLKFTLENVGTTDTLLLVVTGNVQGQKDKARVTMETCWQKFWWWFNLGY